MSTPKITYDLDWSAAQQAMATGRRARRSLWITWVKPIGGRLTFLLPESWRGCRRYRPTAVDMSSNDWMTTT